MSRQPNRKTPRRVYFLEAGKDGAIKIGVAIDVSARMRDLQGANAETLSLLVDVPGDHRDERRLHNRFVTERLNGEWFKATGGVRAFVWALIGMTEAERVAAIKIDPTPADIKRARKSKPKPKPYTPEERRALLFVGDGGSIYRSAEAEAGLLENDRRRAAAGLPPWKPD